MNWKIIAIIAATAIATAAAVVFILQKHFAVDGKHGPEGGHTFLGELCLVVAEHDVGVEYEGAGL